MTKLTVEQLKALSKISDEVLEIIDHAGEFSRGDLQAVVEQKVRTAYELGRIEKAKEATAKIEAEKFPDMNDFYCSGLNCAKRLLIED